MLSLIRRSSVTGITILSAILVISGCSSRKYVRLQTQTLEPAIQEAQKGVRENAERIDTVDRRAQQGITAASAADAKATAAQEAAQAAAIAAQGAERKADAANQGVQQANNRFTTIETSILNINTLDSYTQGDMQTVRFDVNKSDLSSQAKGTLDKIASDMSGLRAGYMIEIQGFTDSTGSDDSNLRLSQRRADSVQRYLVGKNIPLYRISLVGLGEDKPVGENKTKAGRDQNRRVEVQVLRVSPGRSSND